MGKITPRLASRKKAKRWAKGQSSSSNPETNKYRDQARSRFFQPTLGPSNLTTESLKKHDAVHGLASSDKIEIDDDDASTGTTFKTFGTFASDFSNCSNISFSRFQNNFQSSSLIHKEMLAALTAVTEHIKEQGSTESSTAYYAALMTTLERAESDESVAALLSLLGMCIKTVPKNVLKRTFSTSTMEFVKILSKYANENYLILRHCIGCLSLLLRAQDAAVWSERSSIQLLDGILSFTIHEKPKVRKVAQHAISTLLKGSEIMKAENPPAYHPAAPCVAEFCLKELKKAGEPGSITTTLHVLTMLKDIAYQMPKSYVKLICENLLPLMTLNNTIVKSCCLQSFHSLFVSRPSKSIMPAELNARIINALYDYQPAPGDTQPTLAWLAVMQEAHLNLVEKCVHLCAANIPRMIGKTTELWLSDKHEVVSGASHTIKTLLQSCLSPMCENAQTIQKYQKPLSKVFNFIRQGLKFQFNTAWHHVLHLIAVLFEVSGHTCQAHLSPILVELAELRDTHKFTYNSEVEYAVGAAVKSMGPEIVLANIPLQTSNNVIDMRRSWMLPVLKECIQRSSLKYFIESMKPLAEMCEQKMEESKRRKDGISTHSYELLISQIWALLPCFCNNPPDIQENFMKMAKQLRDLLVEKKDLRLSILAALRKLITVSSATGKQDDLAVLANVAKNYLPALFNLYTTKPNGSDEEGQRLAVFDTIKIYLPITPPEWPPVLFDNALENIKNSPDDFTKQSLFDLIRVMTPYTDRERLQGIYDKCLLAFNDNQHPKEQKKAYKFLEEICKNDVPLCADFVKENRRLLQTAIKKSAEKTCTSSRTARLRCIAHLVEIHPQLQKTKFLAAIVPEIVACTKDLNEKCRLTAYQLLNTIGDKFISIPEHFSEYIQMIMAGLTASPTHVSATLLVFASLTYKYNGSIGIPTINEILGHACTLITGPTREITMSALSYVKVYLSALPTPVIGPNLSTIMQGLSGMTDDCKRHFRQKVRDILVKLVRKFGLETISGLVSSTDELMHKRLKNIRKIEARKQKAKEERRSKEAEDESDDEFNVKKKPKTIEEILADSEEEFDETDGEQDDKSTRKKKGAGKIWIQEDANNIVDLADPSAVKNIMSTRPGQGKNTIVKEKSKDHGFKRAEDGRLIIADSDAESDDGMVKKEKKKLPFLGSDDDDDYEEDIDDKSVMSVKPGKRKRTSSDTASVATTSQYRPGGSGIHRPIKAMKLPGAEYKSKKARGDVKKKDKPEPYAYLPLTRAALNKRKKMKNAGRFKGVIAGTKKGAKTGGKKNKKM